MDKEISDQHLDDISLSCCGKWRFLCSILKLPQILVEDLDRSSLQENEKRRIFFKEWKLQKGSCATYQELVNALLTIDCRKDADYVHSFTSAQIAESKPTAITKRRDKNRGNRVTVEDVNFLMTQLAHYAYKWDAIGSALNFLPGELDNIRYSPQAQNLQQRLREVLTQWCQWPTRHHSDSPTLEALCIALRGNLVNLGALATEIYALKDQLPSHQIKDPVPHHPSVPTSNAPVDAATKNIALPRQPDYVPLKIVSFIIMIFVLILTGAYSIPLVMFIYGIALMAISLSLAG